MHANYFIWSFGLSCNFSDSARASALKAASHTAGKLSHRATERREGALAGLLHAEGEEKRAVKAEAAALSASRQQNVRLSGLAVSFAPL